MNPTQPPRRDAANGSEVTTAQQDNLPITEQNAGPEPSTEDQVDIASRVQQGIEQANARRSDEPACHVPFEGKSSRYDGNPIPRQDAEGGVLKPADDTPAVLRKTSGASKP
jgi:hypothetical protein